MSSRTSVQPKRNEPQPKRINKAMLARLATLYQAKENSAEARAYLAAFGMAAESLGLDPSDPGLGVNIQTGEFIRNPNAPTPLPIPEPQEAAE